MSELNLIKTVLYNSSSINEALTRLDELNISYSESDIVDFHKINNHDIQFWLSRSAKCPLTVVINGQFQTYDDRTPFLARQLPAVEQLVTAENSPELVGERPITFKPVAISNSRLFKPNSLRSILDTEKRLRTSTAEGYQL